ncbi:MAG: ABC transporter permease [Acidimicrobiales bacterium]
MVRPAGTGSEQAVTRYSVMPRWRSVRRLPPPLNVGAAIVMAMFLFSFVGPYVYTVSATNPTSLPLASPSVVYPLGSDGVGRDVLAQLMVGGRVALLVAAFAGLGTVVLGAGFGMFAGLFGGMVEKLMMRIVDVVLTIPKLPLLILISAFLQPGVIGVAVIIALTSWAPVARVMRSQTLALRSSPKILAARGAGARSLYLFRRHLVPDLALLLSAGLITAAGRAVLIQAGLAFLGVGTVTVPSWGLMLHEALDSPGLLFTHAWLWWLLPPVIALALLLVGLMFVGAGLEQYVNPKLSRHNRAQRLIENLANEAA